MPQVSKSEAIVAPVPMTPLQELRHYFKRNKGTAVSLVYVAVMVIITMFTDFLTPYNPADQFRDPLLALPSWQGDGSPTYLPGADDVGRDILSCLIYGARLSLLVGCLVVVSSLILGVVFGLVAGYFGGVVGSVVMRVVGVIPALPNLLLALMLVAIFGSPIVNTSLTLTFVALPYYVRLTRAAMLAKVNRDHVTASHVAGTGAIHQMLASILPNYLAPLIVQASLNFSSAILDVVALGFLGMGTQPSTPEWDTVLSDILQPARNAWWVVALLGVTTLLTVLVFNLMSDGPRDAFDLELEQ